MHILITYIHVIYETYATFNQYYENKRILDIAGKH